MAWNFRGSLTRIEFQGDTRMLLPFHGCAWLSDDFNGGDASDVFDARLELLRQDDIMIEAIRDEAAGIAARCGTLAANPTGCIYRLGSRLNMVAGVSPETMAMIKDNLLTSLAERRLHLTATVEFPGFAAEDPIARLASSQPGGVTRAAFAAGQSAIHFDACSLGITANAWVSQPMREIMPFMHAAARDEQPRL